MKWYSSSMLLRGRSVESAIRAIAAAGYDGVEVWVDQATEHEEEPAHLRALAADAGLGVTVHASSYDLNLMAWNRGIRAESLRQTIASLEFASEMQAAVVVVHPGRTSSSRDRIDDQWSAMLSSLEPIDDAAHRLGLTVGLELMEKRPKEVVMLPDDARRIMEHGFRAIGITVDLAHAWSHYDPVRFLRDLHADWITHVHLSDGDSTTVHLPLGEGVIDLGALHAALVDTGYSKAVTIEGYADGRGSELIAANYRVIQGFRHGRPT